MNRKRRMGRLTPISNSRNERRNCQYPEDGFDLYICAHRKKVLCKISDTDNIHKTFFPAYKYSRDINFISGSFPQHVFRTYSLTSL